MNWFKNNDIQQQHEYNLLMAWYKPVGVCCIQFNDGYITGGNLQNGLPYCIRKIVAIWRVKSVNMDVVNKAIRERMKPL